MWTFILLLVLQISAMFTYVIDDGERLDTDVLFHMYTRKNPTNRQTFTINDLDGFQQSFFNASLPIKMYSAGWPSGENNYARDQYLLSEDCNYFNIEWQVLAPSAAYVEPAIRVAGIQTGAFIDFIIQNTTATNGSFHLIGHSAGAHVVGGAGKEVTMGTLARISGLDPAWNVPNTMDPSIATFVDIVHTMGGPVLDGYLGIYDVMGHIDFYANGGQQQPGCPPTAEDCCCCSHCRAADYFIESVYTSPYGFVALKCDSYEAYENGTCNNNLQEFMGDHVSTSARGVYYLDTNAQYPYAKG